MSEHCTVLPQFPFNEPWMSESFALTRALQASISSPTTTSTITTTSPDFTPIHHRKTPLAVVPNSRITKRKSRASKRTPTTYITADVENFREMVQRVTGGPVAAEYFRPAEPVGNSSRAVGELPDCLPTLDTSAFLLERPVQSGLVEPGFELGDLVSGFPTLESWACL